MSRNKDRINLPEIESAQQVEKPLSFINSQTIAVELPSEGFFYPEDHALYMKEYIEIFPMTAKEIDILSDMSLNKKGLAIPKVLQSIIAEPNVQLKSLLTCDEAALMIAARIYGIGSTYDTKVVCEWCEQHFEHTFDLTELETIKRPWEDYGTSVELTDDRTFKTTLPISGKIFEFRFLSGWDEEELQNNLAFKKKKGKRAKKFLTEAAGPSSRARQMAVSFDGETKKGHIADLIRSMPAIDLGWITRLYNSILPEIDSEVELECPHCGRTQEVMVPITRDFLWPSKLRKSFKK